jgi:plasmid stabilization system protein ParE
MIKPVTFDPRAKAEVIAAVGWYERHSASAAAGFKRAFDAAIAQIQDRPTSFPVYLGSQRKCLLKRYPYLLIFEELLDQVWITAVAHASRKPGYWLNRRK